MKSFNILLIAVITLIGFNSCSKDDDGNDSIKGNMEIDGKSYKLKSGVLENYIKSEDDNLYNFGVNLFSNDIETLDDEQLSTKKKFSKAYFAMWSEIPSGLTEGIYTFNNIGEKALTFSLGIITIDYGIISSGTNHEINSGEIEISKNGNIYKIRFEGTTFKGKNVSLEYKGKLTIN